MCVYALDVYPTQKEMSQLLGFFMGILTVYSGKRWYGKYAYKETCIDRERSKKRSKEFSSSYHLRFYFHLRHKVMGKNERH
jgi:hypothetical protein